MGIGDNLLGSGMARGAAARGKIVAFGDGEKIIWDQNSELIFRGNPNVLKPGTRSHLTTEWVRFHKGHRVYNKAGPNCWIWNYDFRPTPGEVFLSSDEKRYATSIGEEGFIVIEPNVPMWKSVAVNKVWPVDRYEKIAGALRQAGFDVVQLTYPTAKLLANARHVMMPNFRFAVAALARSSLYIGPEGGLHHAAAAVDVPAVVLFGGFIPPQVTGYDTHTNLTGGVEACGSITACPHCKDAMDRISVDEVYAAATGHLQRG